jgi:hypothetical protein
MVRTVDRWVALLINSALAGWFGTDPLTVNPTTLQIKTYLLDSKLSISGDKASIGVARMMLSSNLVALKLSNRQ